MAPPMSSLHRAGRARRDLGAVADVDDLRGGKARRACDFSLCTAWPATVQISLASSSAAAATCSSCAQNHAVRDASLPVSETSRLNGAGCHSPVPSTGLFRHADSLACKGNRSTVFDARSPRSHKAVPYISAGVRLLGGGRAARTAASSPGAPDTRNGASSSPNAADRSAGHFGVGCGCHFGAGRGCHFGAGCGDAACAAPAPSAGDATCFGRPSASPPSPPPVDSEPLLLFSQLALPGSAIARVLAAASARHASPTRSFPPARGQASPGCAAWAAAPSCTAGESADPEAFLLEGDPGTSICKADGKAFLLEALASAGSAASLEVGLDRDFISPHRISRAFDRDVASLAPTLGAFERDLVPTPPRAAATSPAASACIGLNCSFGACASSSLPPNTREAGSRQRLRGGGSGLQGASSVRPPTVHPGSLSPGLPTPATATDSFSQAHLARAAPPRRPPEPPPAPLTLRTHQAVGALVVGPPGHRPPPPTTRLKSGFHSHRAVARARALAQEGACSFLPPDRPTASTAAKQRGLFQPPAPHRFLGGSTAAGADPRVGAMPVRSPVEIASMGGREGGGGWRQRELAAPPHTATRDPTGGGGDETWGARDERWGGRDATWGTRDATWGARDEARDARAGPGRGCSSGPHRAWVGPGRRPP